MDTNVYQIDLSKNITVQVLILAGWYPGRSVDISGLLLALGNKNIMFNSNSEEFWRGYYGLKDTWYFKWKDAKGKVHIGG